MCLSCDGHMQTESNRIMPVKNKMEELEVKRDKVQRERAERDTSNLTEQENFRVILEGLRNKSDTIKR